MKTKLFYGLTILFFVLGSKTFAQGWEKTFGESGQMAVGTSTQQTIDGGYIFAGYINTKIWLIKTDPNGTTQWTKKYSHGSLENKANSIAQTSDGGYIIAGVTNHNYNSRISDYYLIKTNINGDTLWTKIYGGSGYDLANSVIQTTDGGYIVAGIKNYDPSYTIGQIYLIKTNSIGDTIWTKSIGATYIKYAHSIKQTTDEGYIITGYTAAGGPGFDILLLKTNSLGDTIWTKNWSGQFSDYGNSVIQTNDGGYIIVGSYSEMSFNVPYVLRTNSNGDTLWTKKIEVFENGYCSDICKTHDGNFIICGSQGNTDESVSLLKINSNGDTIWTKKFGGVNRDNGLSVRQTNDHGFIIGGFTQSFGPGTFNMYLIKTDSLGYSYTNQISGNVFLDSNLNCLMDTNEMKLTNWKIKVEPGPIYITTNSSGNYSFLVDTGSYTITQIIPSYLWGENCPPSHQYIVSFPTFHMASDSLNFGNTIQVSCPYLTIDISTAILRRCPTHDFKYYIHYCNNGTQEANDVLIKIIFDAEIIVNGSSIPWYSSNGNTYFFNMGTSSPNECGDFYVNYKVSCNAIIGQTLCTVAHIYSDSLCEPVDTNWDHSSINVNGNCIGDSLVCFVIKNTGEPGLGDMDGVSIIRVYLDNVLFETFPFQLAGGDSLVKCYTANGTTIRLEADQRPGHPGHSHPRATVELCGNTINPSIGFVTSVPEDDQDDNIEIDCQVVVGSYDPNEKLVKPIGITTNRFIKPTDFLEYQINFQNTGTDTAFIVIIRDTLSPFLDITTLQNGVSSHPCSFRIYGQGILEWTFNNILLPDSNTNEPLSHGFVKFSVNQKLNNPNGTLIENISAIIFDFNAPVITNTTWNIVSDTVIISALTEKNDFISDIKIFPNPFNNTATISVDEKIIKQNKNIELKLYDLLGREVNTIKIKNQFTIIDRTKLNNGIYLFKVQSKNKIIGQGKLIID